MTYPDGTQPPQDPQEPQLHLPPAPPMPMPPHIYPEQMYNNLTPPPFSPQPYYGLPPQPPLARPTSGFATASMVLGIIGLLVGWCSFGLPSMIAVVLGHAALKETKTGMRGGHGLAMTGLILGYIVTVPALLFTIFFIIGAASN